MRKIILIAVLLSIFAVFSATAQVQFRLDPLVTIPVYAGSSALGSVLGGWVPNFIPIPELDAYLQFNFTPFRFGVGLMVLTAIIINVVIPDVYAEFDVDPFVFRLSVAGGAFFIFGLLANVITSLGGQSFYTAPIIMPDISVAWKVADFFRLAVGCIFFTDFHNMSNFIFIPYLQARFVIAMPDLSKNSGEAKATTK
jgi:hypothetical protein